MSQAGLITQTGGGGTGITNLAGDAGSATGETVTIAGSTGVSTSAGAAAMTITLGASLASLSATGTAANKGIYYTGANTAAEFDLTAAGRAILDDATASDQRTTLGVVIGTDVQAFDDTLESISALGTAANKMAYTTGLDTWAEAALTTAGRAILDDATAGDQRTTLGLGTIATQAANSVAITGGSVTGITDIVVEDGGSGRGTATAYGVIIGGATATGAHQSVAVGTATQVLTSNGAGAAPTFEDAGGGGGGFDIQIGGDDNNLLSGNEHILNSMSRPVSTAESSDANDLFVACLVIGKSTPVSSLGINIKTAQASSNVRWALFTDDNGDFGTRIFESGAIDTSATGFKFVSTTQTIAAGTYWFAIVPDTSDVTFMASDYTMSYSNQSGTTSMLGAVEISYTYGEIIEGYTFAGKSIGTSGSAGAPILFYEV